MTSRAPGRHPVLLAALLFALLAGTGRSLAQTAPPPAPILRDFMHEKWNNEEGLATPAIQSVLRTKDGYLWLGASRGLHRFDGQRFRAMDPEGSVDGRLNTASITALAEDGDGALWVGTAEYGVARVRGTSVDWFGTAEGLPAVYVRCLFVDRGGQVWAGTDRGLVWFKERVFVSVPGHTLSVNAIAEDAAGDMWVGTGTGTMVVEHGSLVRRRASAGGLDGIVWALLRDRDRRLWAGTNAGLYVSRGGQFAQLREFGPRWVTALAGDRHGRLWVGTSGDGLHVIDGDGAGRRLGVDEGLSQEVVSSLFVDAEGSVWIGTPDGLDRVRARVLRTLAPPGPARMAWTVSPDPAHGGVWVGTNRGLAHARADQPQAEAEERLGPRTVRDVLTTRDGVTWVGIDESLMRLAPGRPPQEVHQPGTMWGRVRALFEDRDGTLWLGGTLAGLMRLDANGRFVRQPFADERDPGRIWTITQDDQGALWVGGHGVHRLADGRWSTFSRETTGLPSDDVMAILPDTNGVWLGAYNEGLMLLRGDLATSFRRFNPAIFPQAYAIVDDGRGYLWVSSSFGLQRMAKRDLLDVADGRRREFEVRSFDKLDGLISPEFNGAGAHAGARTPEGLLWFANSSGAVVVDPAAVDGPPPLAPVRVEAIAADDVLASVHGADIELARGRGRQRLEFQFSSPSLLTPRRVRFRYRLEGFDREWVDSGMRRTATYTGLHGGRYRFRVQAYYAGTLPDAGIETGVNVVLPRYVSETSAFLVSLPLGLLAAGYGFHLLRVRRLRRQAIELGRVVDERTQALRAAQADLERRVHERTAQLEAELGERKRLESQLVQAQKLDSIGRLAGGIAHDLNNLLTAILGYASLAEQASPADMREDVRQITAAGERAARLTQQLLAFARRQVTEPRNLNPNTVVRELEPMLRRLIGEDIELTCSLPDAPWTIRADANQIQQVLVNLVINARDAMPDGGRVSIAATHARSATVDPQDPEFAAGDRVVIAVTDTGTGITDDVKAHLFEPFFTTKPAGKGTGLGLATSYGIVTQAGGLIDVDSVVGRGTTVRVSLPRVAEAPDATDDAPRAELSATGDPRTLLLAEDEELVRAMASRVLRDLGHHVLEAVDGEDALDVAALHTGQLDLLITDLVMPRMGGLDLATRLRARHPELRVVFMSGYADRAVAARLPPGAPMLHKPFTPAGLAQRVEAILSADAVSL